MKLNRCAYQIQFTQDEKVFVILGDSVSIWEYSEVKQMEKYRIKILKNPSYLALSSDEKMFAFKNTSGHIAVGDLRTGQIITTSKGTNREGKNLIFCKNDKMILTSDYDGNIFTLDLTSGEEKIVAKLPIKLPHISVGENSSKVLIIGFNNDIGKGFLRIWEMSLFENDKIEEVTVGEEYWSINCNQSHTINNRIYFFDEETEMGDGVFTMNIATKKVDKVFDIHDIIKDSEELKLNQGGYVCISVSSDERFLILGSYKVVAAFDLVEMKCIGTYQVKDISISSLQFFAHDSKVMICTWIDLRSLDFPDAFLQS